MRVKYVLLLLLWILPAHAQVAADKIRFEKNYLIRLQEKFWWQPIAVTGVMLAKTHWKP